MHRKATGTYPLDRELPTSDHKVAVKKYKIKPLAHALHLEDAPVNSSALAAQWPTVNVRVSSNRVERRWDHKIFRTLADGDVVQGIPVYNRYDNTNYALILTETDLAKVMTGTSETYQYLTQTYVGGHITNITGDTVTGDANAKFLDDSKAEDGDKFILNENHEAAKEPSGTVAKPNPWITLHTDVSHVITNTSIFTEGTYAGTTGDLLGDPKHYKIRKVYSVPSGERWQYATVAGKFCFTNGNVYGQYWSGTDTDYATDINTASIYQARYCVAYANRLWTADMYDAGLGTRNPWILRGSKINDPTNYTDSTAADYYFYDMPDPITGLGVVGDQLIVYRKTMYHFGRRTSTSTDPLYFPGYQTGVGLHAPYSLVHYLGTNAWLGVDNFYTMNGTTAVAIGGPIRKKFFSIIDDDDLEKVFGINNYRYSEILWVAQTTEGQKCFSWNYAENSWSVYEFDGNLSGLGGFGL